MEVWLLPVRPHDVYTQRRKHQNKPKPSTSQRWATSVQNKKWEAVSWYLVNTFWRCCTFYFKTAPNLNPPPVHFLRNQKANVWFARQIRSSSHPCTSDVTTLLKPFRVERRQMGDDRVILKHRSVRKYLNATKNQKLSLKNHKRDLATETQIINVNLRPCCSQTA